MGEYKLHIYSRKWGHKDSYTIEFSDSGWILRGARPFNNGICDPTGMPALINTLKHEGVNYPVSLGAYLEIMWHKIAEKKIGEDEIQESFDALFRWVSLCEKNSPEGIWEEEI